MTMNRRFSNSFAHFVWCGRMPLWSMSGFVATMWARVRMARRAEPGVSPSYTSTPIGAPAPASPASARIRP